MVSGRAALLLHVPVPPRLRDGVVPCRREDPSPWDRSEAGPVRLRAARARSDHGVHRDDVVRVRQHRLSVGRTAVHEPAAVAPKMKRGRKEGHPGPGVHPPWPGASLPASPETSAPPSSGASGLASSMGLQPDDDVSKQVTTAIPVAPAVNTGAKHVV